MKRPLPKNKPMPKLLKHPVTLADVIVRREILESASFAMFIVTGRIASLDLEDYVKRVLRQSCNYAELLSFGMVSMDTEALNSLAEMDPRSYFGSAGKEDELSILYGLPKQERRAAVQGQKLTNSSYAWLSYEMDRLVTVTLVWRNIVGLGKFIPVADAPSPVDEFLVQDIEAKHGISEMIRAALSGVPVMDATGGFVEV